MIGIRRALLSATVVVLGFTAFLGAAAMTSVPAGAQTEGSCQALVPNYEGTANVTVDKTQVKPGETLTIVGKGFPPGAEVKVSVSGTVVGTPTADAQGAFTLTFTVPGDATAGPITVSADCAPLVLNQTVSVLGETVGSLPKTGSNVWSEVRIGGALILVGAVLVIAVRKRRTVTV